MLRNDDAPLKKGLKVSYRALFKLLNQLAVCRLAGLAGY
jgi:hypothetical protein